MSENQASNQVSVDTIKQLYDTLLELRRATKELESSETAAELSRAYDRLDHIVNAVIDFIQHYPYTWQVRLSNENEIEIAYLYEPSIALYVNLDWSAPLVEIYNKFFNEKGFVETMVKMLTRTVSEIADLIKRGSDIYTKVAKLDGKIDQLYRDIKKLCPQRDP